MLLGSSGWVRLHRWQSGCGAGAWSPNRQKDQNEYRRRTRTTIRQRVERRQEYSSWCWWSDELQVRERDELTYDTKQDEKRRPRPITSGLLNFKKFTADQNVFLWCLICCWCGLHCVQQRFYRVFKYRHTSWQTPLTSNLRGVSGWIGAIFAFTIQLLSRRTVDMFGVKHRVKVFQMHYFGTLLEYMQEKSDISKLQNVDGQISTQDKRKVNTSFHPLGRFQYVICLELTWRSAFIPLWTQRCRFKSFKPSWWRTIRWRAVSHH